MRGFTTELWALLKAHKKFWLSPIVLILLLYVALLVLSQASAVGSFLDTLF